MDDNARMQIREVVGIFVKTDFFMAKKRKDTGFACFISVMAMGFFILSPTQYQNNTWGYDTEFTKRMQENVI